MFIIDKPYVSDLLRETIYQNIIPVLKTDFAAANLDSDKTIFWNENFAVEQFRSGRDDQVYTSSENSLQWVADHLQFSDLPGQVSLFKDKYRFRELTTHIFPPIYYRAVFPEELDDVSINDLPFPFIIKPSIGFFSHGVFKVTNKAEWDVTKEQIKKEIKIIKDVYPHQVLDTARFIIEENIEGEEYAFDARYDEDGEPVILGMMKHLFSNGTDVSDRVYITSKEIISSKLKPFDEFLRKLGTLADLRNFPLHVELRITKNGDLVPIEINPLRFGGWCTSAELTWHAYGFNPYAYCHTKQNPDWQKILEQKDDSINSIIVLNNSTGIDVNRIASFDYDDLLSRFSSPLELRRADFRKYLIFGFLFAETTRSSFAEIDFILNSDLREFVGVV